MKRAFAMSIAAFMALLVAARSGSVRAQSPTTGGAATAQVWKVELSSVEQGDAAVTTRRIQAALDVCSKAGGGRVVVPAGTYALTPLRLRSGVDLHLDRGAILLFSRTMTDYDLVRIDDGSGPEPGLLSPISGQGLTHVAVTGEGVIDGQGDAWRSVKKSKLTPEAWGRLVHGGVVNAAGDEWSPDEVARDGRPALDRLMKSGPQPLEAFAPYRILMRPNLVRLTDCTDVRLEGVTFRNSPGWNVHLALCDRIRVRGITIFNPAWAQNGDGIDFDSCRDVTMTDSTVDAGDDAICLKSGKDLPGRQRGRPTENVTIERCSVGTGHGGVVIGSEVSGGVRNVAVNDCVFNGTDNGLRFKSVRGRGGVVEDVRVRNIKMARIGGVAILFDLYYGTKISASGPTTVPVSDATPAFRDFRLSDISCEGAKYGLQLRGLPEMPLQDIVLERVDVRADDPGSVTDVTRTTFRDVHVTAGNGAGVRVQDASQVTILNCSGFQK